MLDLNGNLINVIQVMQLKLQFLSLTQSSGQVFSALSGLRPCSFHTKVYLSTLHDKFLKTRWNWEQYSKYLYLR